MVRPPLLRPQQSAQRQNQILHMLSWRRAISCAHARRADGDMCFPPYRQRVCCWPARLILWDDLQLFSNQNDPPRPALPSCIEQEAGFLHLRQPGPQVIQPWLGIARPSRAPKSHPAGLSTAHRRGRLHTGVTFAHVYRAPVILTWSTPVGLSTFRHCRGEAHLRRARRGTALRLAGDVNDYCPCTRQWRLSVRRNWAQR